jgi:hypothetical protein
MISRLIKAAVLAVALAAGYLVGTREGKDGLARLQKSWQAIKTSPEVRRLAGEAITVAEGVAKQVAGRGVGAIGESAARTIVHVVGGGRQEESRAA